MPHCCSLKSWSLKSHEVSMTDDTESLAWFWDGSTEPCPLEKGCLEVTKRTRDNAFTLPRHEGKQQDDRAASSGIEIPQAGGLLCLSHKHICLEWFINNAEISGH